MTPIVAGLGVLWAALMGASLTGYVLSRLHLRRLDELRRLWDEERAAYQQDCAALADALSAEQVRTGWAETRVHWLTRALEAEREEQEGETWKRGRPAELDDADRQH